MGKLKSIAASVITCPFIGRIIASVYKNYIPFRGNKVFTDSNAISPAVKARLFWQLYESAECRFIAKYLPADQDIVELGSSIGVVGTIAGKKKNAGKKIICIEADANLIPLIKKNMEINAIEGWKVKHCAVSTEKASAGSFQAGSDNTTGKLQQYAGEGPSGDTKIPFKKLSDIVEEENLTEYSLICDIEGAEADIIWNDPQSLKNCTCLIIETHQTVLDGKEIFPEDIKKQLSEEGFKLIDQYGVNMVFEKN